jgi:hypothetical protein
MRKKGRKRSREEEKGILHKVNFCYAVISAILSDLA